MNTKPSRRQFLKTAVAGAAVSALPSAAIAATPAAQAQTSPSQVAPFELAELTLVELQKAMQSGKHTSRRLVELYTVRIHQIDTQGPKLSSVIELNPDALADADALDGERKAKGPRGPLHGIPVLIKDNIATADKMQTTAGSLALVGAHPPKDSGVAARLRAAGAVILGKTNLSEWANWRSTHSTSGWSGRGGLTPNAYVLDRNASGSSSGSGAATAANLCAVAVGSETDGSIISPSSQGSLVGIKPTVGLVSRFGIVPISRTQDTAGPMARCVADAAALLSALAGADPGDPATAAAAGHIEQDYTRFLDPNRMRGARLGVVRKLAGFQRDVDGLFNDALAAMKSAGAEIVDPVEIPTLGKFDDAENLVLQYEFKAGLFDYLAWIGPSAPVHSLKEVIEFNRMHADTELKYFGQEIFEKCEDKGPLTSEEYTKALADCGRMSRVEGIDAVMDKFKLDALVAPSDSPAWPNDFINGDHFTCSTTTMPAVAGYPHITVPMGFVSELPVGVSFFGRRWSESSLIALGYAYERLTRHRRPPRFLPTLEM